MNHSLLSGDYINDSNPLALASRREFLLVAQVAERNEQAFSELYHRYSPALHAYLVHMVQDRLVAEDLIQEVFLAVWRGASRFRGHSTVKTWLYRIAHHQAVSWLRKNVRIRSNGLDAASEDPDPTNLVQARLLRDEVRQALQRLSPNHRAVVELTFFHELSYQEIAEIMECPVGTVKSRMSYARKYLNQHLEQAGLVDSE